MKIISGFPGIGKSYSFYHQHELGASITDSDSSLFSKIKRWDGSFTENSAFPSNYMEHIQNLIRSKKYDYILVSSHKIVRESMANLAIPYTLIYPSASNKNLYMQKYIDRGSPDRFIDYLDKFFYQFVEECEHDKGASEKIVLDDHKTLFDWLKIDFGRVEF